MSTTQSPAARSAVTLDSFDRIALSRVDEARVSLAASRSSVRELVATEIGNAGRAFVIIRDGFSGIELPVDPSGRTRIDSSVRADIIRNTAAKLGNATPSQRFDHTNPNAPKPTSQSDSASADAIGKALGRALLLDRLLQGTTADDVAATVGTAIADLARIDTALRERAATLTVGEAPTHYQVIAEAAEDTQSRLIELNALLGTLIGYRDERAGVREAFTEADKHLAFLQRLPGRILRLTSLASADTLAADVALTFSQAEKLGLLSDLRA